MTNENTKEISIQKPKTFSSFLTQPAIKNRICEIITTDKDRDQFLTSIISAVTANQALQECDFMSIFSCALQGQALKLSPSTVLGHYFMIPFKDYKNNTVNAAFVIGYKGLIQLAIRSGYYKKINVIELREGEVKKANILTEDYDIQLIEDDFEREQKEVTHYYAMFQYLNGFTKEILWKKEKVMAHADRYVPKFDSKTYLDLVSKGDHTKSKIFWYNDFDGQAKKTLLRQLISKFGIMSIEMQTAIEKDNEYNEYAQKEAEKEKEIPNIIDVLNRAEIISNEVKQ